MDEDGYCRIISRKADMWYASRAKPALPAFPRDVEEVIYEIPQVKEAAVVGIAGHPFAFVIAGRDRPTACFDHLLLQAQAASAPGAALRHLPGRISSNLYWQGAAQGAGQEI